MWIIELEWLISYWKGMLIIGIGLSVIALWFKLFGRPID